MQIPISTSQLNLDAVFLFVDVGIKKEFLGWKPILLGQTGDPCIKMFTNNILSQRFHSTLSNTEDWENLH